MAVAADPAQPAIGRDDRLLEAIRSDMQEQHEFRRERQGRVPVLRHQRAIGRADGDGRASGDCRHAEELEAAAQQHVDRIALGAGRDAVEFRRDRRRALLDRGRVAAACRRAASYAAAPRAVRAAVSALPDFGAEPHAVLPATLERRAVQGHDRNGGRHAHRFRPASRSTARITATVMTMVRVETAKIAGLKEVLLCWNSQIESGNTSMV